MIFIDTGAYLARFIEKDQYHLRAINHWKVLKKSNRPCFTSNFVLNETFTLLARRTTYEFSCERAKSIYDSDLLTILRPEFQDEIAALALFQKYADQSVSFTDCVSFVLMRKRNIANAFSFDRHFTLAGFHVEP